jgi:AraC-like DNA-binding protein
MIWLVDLRQYADRAGIEQMVRTEARLHTIPWSGNLEARLRREPEPCGIFCDFDYPDIPRLGAIARIKALLPSVPIVMFTEEHSEALAVWALRSRVWNYFVKPVDGDCIRDTAMRLWHLQSLRRAGEQREVLPPAPLPAESRFTAADPRAAIQPALSYLERSIGAAVSQREAAAACGMSASGFSRAFKRAIGTTFQDYVTERRLLLAARLLANRSASVTDVGFSCGFRDVSHFSRAFRRRFNVSPSDFRLRVVREATDRGVAATGGKRNATVS